MAFDIFSYVTDDDGLRAGDVIALQYAPARGAAKYRPAGKHYALAPNEALQQLAATFGPTIQIVWPGPKVAPAARVKFQFETVDGITGYDGYEIAHANGDNIDWSKAPTQPVGAPIDSPAFTGTPTAPTPPPNDNTTRLATTAFVITEVAQEVTDAVAALVGTAPAALDSLNELAAALGNDPNFAATMNAQLATKASSNSPTFTGTITNDGDLIVNGFAQLAQMIRFSGAITPAAIAAQANDYAPAGAATATVWRISSASSQLISGIAGGVGGRILFLQNVGGFPITLLNEDNGSIAANRFAFGVNRTIETQRSMLLIYDATFQRWLDLMPLTKALAATFWQGSDDQRFMTSKAVYDANAPIAVGYAATVTLDLATGQNFDIGTLTGNLVLANPTNAKIGQSGRIKITNGNPVRTISYGSNWKMAGGAQALTATVSAVDMLYYYVHDAAYIEATMAKAFA